MPTSCDARGGYPGLAHGLGPVQPCPERRRRKAARSRRRCPASLGPAVLGPAPWAVADFPSNSDPSKKTLVSTSFERYLASVASTFPSLRGAPLHPWEAFPSWAEGLEPKSAAWWAARFIIAFRLARLRGWASQRRGPDVVVNYGFDIFEAQAAWTDGDRQAAAYWLMTCGTRPRSVEPATVECGCEPPLRISIDLITHGGKNIVCHACTCPFTLAGIAHGSADE